MQVDKITDKSLELLNTMVKALYYGNPTPTSAKEIVRDYVEKDEGVKQLLGLMYDPLIKYHYKLPYEDYDFDVDDCNDTDSKALLDVLQQLALYGKTMSKKKKTELVWSYLENKSDILALFLRRTLDIGFGLGSAKELGIVSAFNPQKGVLLKDVERLKYPCIADFKYNGSRLVTIIGLDGSVEFRLLRIFLYSRHESYGRNRIRLPFQWSRYDFRLY